MDLLVKINNFQPLTILAKSSISDFRLASGCTSIETYVLMLHLWSPEYRKGLISRALFKLTPSLSIEFEEVFASNRNPQSQL